MRESAGVVGTYQQSGNRPESSGPIDSEGIRGSRLDLSTVRESGLIMLPGLNYTGN